MYSRFTWSEVEPEKGQFDFSAIDAALASAKQAGQRLAFRVMGYSMDPGPTALRDAYPLVLAAALDAWKTAPVILEPCGTMATWVSSGYPWQQALDWAVANHVSQYSNKSDTIPPPMLTAVQEMTAKLGCRLVLESATLPDAAPAGADLPVQLSWTNVGNAPMYMDRVVLVRVGSLVTQSTVNPRGLLPGRRTDSVSAHTAGLGKGTFDVALGLAPPRRSARHSARHRRQRPVVLARRGDAALTPLSWRELCANDRPR